MAIPLIVPVGIVAGIALVAFGGGGSSSSDAVRPVVPLKTTKQKLAGRAVICTCYRGGAQEFYALVVCALTSIYPDADNDWRPLVDLALDDSAELDAGTRKAVKWVRNRATALLKLQTEAERAKWCGEPEEPDPPDEILPPLPPPPPPPPGPGRVARARELFLGLRSALPVGASFWQPTQGQADSMGLLATARAMLRSEGIENPTNAQRSAYARMMEASAWNQSLYGRIKKDGETIHHEGRTIRLLYNPRHVDAALAIMQGRRPQRTIFDSGNKKGGITGANKYGTPWLPGVDRGALAQGFVLPDPTTAEPPAELLGLLEAA